MSRRHSRVVEITVYPEYLWPDGPVLRCDGCVIPVERTEVKNP